ncbi:ankyrin repeat domain-containing protein [Pseudomonas fluorescens]|uniref:ankyrin repeat domain-containing protein n=1 Tax=Pseudomonas fluorescens TaxID=294 RepID=UPI0021CECF51|nr:ankyrin repeat domain-containing protein [Pseudomonas fluorescens]UXV17544.1 ankyrin repeat domain-containing protein [Pseudomonas fluorescens]
MSKKGFSLSVILLLFLSLTACQSNTRVAGNTVNQVYKDAKVTAMINAAMDGRTQDVAKFASQGADVNGEGTDGTTPLIWAIKARNWQGTEALLKAGADPNFATEKFKGISPMWLMSGGNSLEGLALMLRYGGDAKGDSQPHMRDRPLNLAASEGRLENVKLLVAAGADINAHDSFGGSAADEAAIFSHFEVVAWLLEHGYNYDLNKLAKLVQIGREPPGSESQRWKNTVISMLEKRGVTFLTPVTRDPRP